MTVWIHLKGRGLQLRDKVEAQLKAVTKYPKNSFHGPETERAYLAGFASGDCQVLTTGVLFESGLLRLTRQWQVCSQVCLEIMDTFKSTQGCRGW